MRTSRRWRRRPVCRSTGKVRFRDQLAADQALLDGAHGVRSYHCNACRGWHTTSRPLITYMAPTSKDTS